MPANAFNVLFSLILMAILIIYFVDMFLQVVYMGKLEKGE